MSKIIIIGAGMAGLSAGIYGQSSGYQTEIFELHDKPGGLCTSWKRKGYTFDGCIHWLVGSRSGSAFNKIWREMGALGSQRSVHNHGVFTRVEDETGKAFVVYTNVDRLVAHMKELAPADSKAIDQFGKHMRTLGGMSDAMGAVEEMGLWAGLTAMARLALAMPTFRQMSKISVPEYAQRFNDPFLRWAFGKVFDAPDFPVMGLMMSLAWMNDRDAGYPIGGSLAFSRDIEARYLELGGTIHYRSKVAEILVEGDQAVGIRLTDGSEHRADVVVSAADGHATIFDMLHGRYVDDKIRSYFETYPIFSGVVQVSLGVNRDLTGTPAAVNVPLSKPLTVSGQERRRLSFRHFDYDPTLAPEGKSVIVAMFESDHAYWKDVADDQERYDSEKQHIAEGVIDALETRFPGISQQVEVVDVATPLTTERYTGNWQGSIEGWFLSTKDPGLVTRGMEKTLPGLGNFYMTGQWVEPGGGLPSSARSGRQLIKTICKRDRVKFRTP